VAESTRGRLKKPFGLIFTADEELGCVGAKKLVELNKGSTPWVRNREQATLFAANRFSQPPTTR
jgi:acetylornithine deacetylase/succinyl-diaminopimelate desuccinylase-like protein